MGVEKMGGKDEGGSGPAVSCDELTRSQSPLAVWGWGGNSQPLLAPGRSKPQQGEGENGQGMGVWLCLELS